MRVIEKGHVYAVQNQDVRPGDPTEQVIAFVRRLPKDQPPAAGTLCQELIRVLLDRVSFLDRQEPCHENVEIRTKLRQILVLFEQRAARRHMEKMLEVEYVDPNPEDGHLMMPFVEHATRLETAVTREQDLAVQLAVDFRGQST